MRKTLFALTLSIFAVGAIFPMKAQSQARGDDAVKEAKNAWTIGLATGQLDASYPRLAQDIAKVLDDSDEMRILPIMTHGAVTNVEDLLWLRGVDIAFTKSDSFEYYRKVKKINNIQDRIHFIARLFSAELHILVPKHITSLQQLEGKKIANGIVGSASNVTMPIVLEKLGINAELLFIDQAIGIEMMRKGEIDAVSRVGSKPMSTYTSIPADSGFHFLPLPSLKLFTDLYSLGELTHKDYPKLIPEGQVLDTISVSEVLAVYNWPKDSDRYRRVARFTERFYEKFDQLQQKPFHEKWKDVNLAGALPGWTRFEVAERILKQLVPQDARLRQEFDTFVREKGGPVSLNDQERGKFFRQFMEWRSSRE